MSKNCATRSSPGYAWCPAHEAAPLRDIGGLPSLARLTLRAGAPCAPTDARYEDLDAARAAADDDDADAADAWPRGWKKLPAVLEEDQCALCHDALSGPASGERGGSVEVEALFETCGHVFHRACLESSMRYAVRTNLLDRGRLCPTCKVPIAEAVRSRLLDGMGSSQVVQELEDDSEEEEEEEDSDDDEEEEDSDEDSDDDEIDDDVELVVPDEALDEAYAARAAHAQEWADAVVAYHETVRDAYEIVDGGVEGRTTGFRAAWWYVREYADLRSILRARADGDQFNTSEQRALLRSAFDTMIQRRQHMGSYLMYGSRLRNRQLISPWHGVAEEASAALGELLDLLYRDVGWLRNEYDGRNGTYERSRASPDW